MTRVNNVYAVVVYLVFAIAVFVIGALALAAFRGVLLLFLAILFGFLLGRQTVVNVHTGKQSLPKKK
jgi:hypothetical protein